MTVKPFTSFGKLRNGLVAKFATYTASEIGEYSLLGCVEECEGLHSWKPNGKWTEGAEPHPFDIVSVVQ